MRLNNISRNQQMLAELGLDKGTPHPHRSKVVRKPKRDPSIAHGYVPRPRSARKATVATVAVATEAAAVELEAPIRATQQRLVLLSAAKVALPTNIKMMEDLRISCCLSSQNHCGDCSKAVLLLSCLFTWTATAGDLVLCDSLMCTGAPATDVH